MASLSASGPSSAPAGAPARAPDRAAVLAAVLDPKRLPTPPSVALQVASAASRPNCNPDEIVTLLQQDPALCGKMLKAVNSCLYGLSKPLSSLERAVTVLGLGPVRSLALGLSLPAVKTGPADRSTRNYQITSVAGAIIARSLSARTNRGGYDDDMVAGLLRDMGVVLLQQTYPDAWRAMTEEWGDRLLTEACEAEEETFGVNHAEVSAELLTQWGLPPDIVEPIRYHHDPKRLAGAPREQLRRAELLYTSELLANLDTVIRHPHVFEFVLEVARTRYGMPKPKLIEFLRGVIPKITDFGEALNRDVRDCPDFAQLVEKAGTEPAAPVPAKVRPRARVVAPPASALDAPTVVDTTLPGAPFARTAREAAPTPPPVPAARGRATPPPAALPVTMPEFRPGFLEEFPSSGCRLGDYELRSVLGRGAMGVVFRAFEPALARFVAVKMLSVDRGDRAVVRERFAREARTCGAIRHENVLCVHAVREAAGVPYLVTELVEGVSLDQYIENRHPIPVPTVVKLGRQIALGLSAAHKKGIVHRDIKLANILLETETGVVKVADFGLARGEDDPSVTQSGSLLGTPNYMSPEQIQGQSATARSDLFSLGCVLYALCTAKLPFEGAHPMKVMNAIVRTDPVPPNQHRADLPSWLVAVVLRLLAKSPADRFATAADVAAALADRP